jgi:hypothetical protein
MDSFNVRALIDTNNECWVNINELLVSILSGGDLIPKQHLANELLKLKEQLIKGTR